jgi:phage shock protein PspC (stress-responsive transcriptional regulator)
MTGILLLLVTIPVLWLLGLIFYVLAWFDWDRKHRYISK